MTTVTTRASQCGRPILSNDGRTMMVHIPITLRHQGGRKQVVTPAGAMPRVPTPSGVDNTIVKATVGAHRWRDMPESVAMPPSVTLPTQKPSTNPALAASCASPCSPHHHRGHP